ncbi:hypothetical protein ATPR_2686 [Acetobacter tropicalis NBRC 101654]|uniref:Uncharacterized protein n=1 Tax=Acetobacter tropicalis NBRC 101654 TaxID=749388 RepID=F7VH37_9PROT|nr:hypothetical protein ATPR_2686 [Acetobacter tropicalis NBRC 101654]
MRGPTRLLWHGTANGRKVVLCGACVRQPRQITRGNQGADNGGVPENFCPVPRHGCGIGSLPGTDGVIQRGLFQPPGAFQQGGPVFQRLRGGTSAFQASKGGLQAGAGLRHFLSHHPAGQNILPVRRCLPVACRRQQRRAMHGAGQGHGKVHAHAVIPRAAVLFFMNTPNPQFRVWHEGAAGKLHGGAGGIPLLGGCLHAGVIFFYGVGVGQPQGSTFRCGIGQNVWYFRGAQQGFKGCGRVLGFFLRHGVIGPCGVPCGIRHLLVCLRHFPQAGGMSHIGADPAGGGMEGGGGGHAFLGQQGGGCGVQQAHGQRHVGHGGLFFRPFSFRLRHGSRGAALPRQPERHAHFPLIGRVAFIAANKMVIKVGARHNRPPRKP